MSGAAFRDERGAAAAELALLVPLVALVLAALVGGARVWFARSTVTDAASAAARAASLSTVAGQAEASGQAAAESSLRTAGLRCADRSVRLDLAGFGVPAGTPAQIAAHVECRVDLADLAGWGVPGSITVSAQAHSALDTYRRRG